MLVVEMALKARRKKVVSGHEALLGIKAIVQEDFKEVGWIRVEGER